VSYGEAQNLLLERFGVAAGRGPGRVRLVSEVVGETLLGLMQEAMARTKSAGPILFEPYAYELQKTANGKVFGVDGLPSYRMEQADVLVSFGRTSWRPGSRRWSTPASSKRCTPSSMGGRDSLPMWLPTSP